MGEFEELAFAVFSFLGVLSFIFMVSVNSVRHSIMFFSLGLFSLSVVTFFFGKTLLPSIQIITYSSFVILILFLVGWGVGIEEFKKSISKKTSSFVFIIITSGIFLGIIERILYLYSDFFKRNYVVEDFQEIFLRKSSLLDYLFKLEFLGIAASLLIIACFVFIQSLVIRRKRVEKI